MRRGQENGKSLSENAVWRYLLQLLLGLQHIHDKKIVHRDIKTLNIFLAADDFIKIGARESASFFAMLKTINLPRQARDKHINS